MTHATAGANIEPTVFGAARRYLTLVIAVAVAAMAIAVGYTLMQPKIYHAQANITVPLPLTLQAQNADPGQYLDSQVLLLQSPSVDQQAADTAARVLGSSTLTAHDFSTSGSGGSLTVAPPTTATAGNYGATIIGVSFAGPSTRVAQIGLNSLLQAYNTARIASTATQTSVFVTGLNEAISGVNNLLAEVNRQLTAPDRRLPFGGESRTALQRERQLLLNQKGDLQTALTQAMANTQAAVAQQPTIATQPATLANHKWTRAAAIGLLIGLVLGGALAYALASRRRVITDRRGPHAFYHVPLMGEIPAHEAGQKWRSNGSSAAREMLPMIANSHSAAAEAFRFTAGTIERVRAARGPQLSLAFVSAISRGGKSAVIANLALALAEGGTRALVVDADDALAARLLPGITGDQGFEHVLAGQRTLAECAEVSSLNSAVVVLRSGRSAAGRMTGAARLQAASKVLAEAKSSFDIVLIDSPALLQVAHATEIVEAADATAIVIAPNEPIQNHREMAERLRLIGAEVVGYIYLQASMQSMPGLVSAAIFHRVSGQSYRRSRVLVDSGHMGATAASQPSQE